MKNITVYSTSWCGFCHQLKEWLKSQNIEFKEVDVEEDQDSAKEIVDATGQMGVPVTKIEFKDKKEYIIGFDRPKLEQALKP